jgi:hypothetical protein
MEGEVDLLQFAFPVYYFDARRVLVEEDVGPVEENFCRVLFFLFVSLELLKTVN